MLIIVSIKFIRVFIPTVEKYNKIKFRLSWKSDTRVWKLIFINYLTTIEVAYKRVT